jgi:putative membrane protein
MSAPRAGSFFQGWIINVLAVMVAAHIVQGIHYDSLGGLVVAAFILGILNMFLRPVLLLFSLPFLILTLGLFVLVINALLLYLVGSLLKSFHVDSFWAAFWGALIISVVSLLVHSFLGGDRAIIKVRSSRRPEPPEQRPGGSGPVIDV